ncbi:hypothetical protein AVEN_227009-1 [Araneus ventricosus]|uniref:Transposable element Tc1 transposase n=1 Tax=Araneus ventricosus TaxID=182803 RepID=A0A4Y2IZY8_ARAVE|nr:hypothetical protein AVEN_227009-1 [Araneus ventricosus]
MDQWATVLFTDEPRFSLNTDSRRTFIWREPGTRYLPSNVLEIDNYGGGGLMVWEGIMLDGTPVYYNKINISKSIPTDNSRKCTFVCVCWRFINYRTLNLVLRSLV